MLLSTPTHLRSSSNIDSNGEIFERPATVPPGTQECDRLYQVEHEPVRKHNLENHLGLKRQKSPPWQKNMDTPSVSFNLGNGYTLHKSKEKLGMTIKMDTVIEAPPKEIIVQTSMPKKKAGLDPAIEALIRQLQEQINDLQYFLEEERYSHRDTIRTAEEVLRNKVNELLQQQENAIKELEAEHQVDMDKLREEHAKALQSQQEEAEAQMAKMKNDIEFLQGAFDSYKTTLHQEMTDKMNKKLEEMKSSQEAEIEKQLEDLKSRMMVERNAEKSALNKEHMRQIQVLSRDHKKELDSLTRRFASASADLEKLKTVEGQYAELKSQHEELSRAHRKTKDQLNTITMDLMDAKMKIKEFEETFQSKVEGVDEKYRGQIHNLMQLNTELRQVYMKKCKQLVDEKNINDTSMVEKVETAKDAMKMLINTRRRANVSMAAGDPDIDDLERVPKERPASAPMTRSETKEALLSAGETDHLVINLLHKVSP